MGKNMAFIITFSIVTMISTTGFAKDLNPTQNKISGAHKDSGKMSNVFPDQCKTPPSPAGPVPVPYPNISMSSNTKKGSKKVKMDGNPITLKESNFLKSTGDEEGTANIISPQHKKDTGYFIQMPKPKRPASSIQQFMQVAPEQTMRPEESFQQMRPLVPKKNWIEMELKGEVVNKIPSELFGIKLPDGTVRKGSIDSQGKMKEDWNKHGTIGISFPEDASKKLEKQ
jgi:hypothetical protein